MSGNLHPHTIVETDVKHEHLLTHGLSVRNQSIECCKGLSKETPTLCFPGGSVVKTLPDNVRDAGPIPGSGRFPGE